MGKYNPKSVEILSELEVELLLDWLNERTLAEIQFLKHYFESHEHMDTVLQ